MSRSVARPRNAFRIARFLTVFVAAIAVVVSTVAPATLATASASTSKSTSSAQVASDPAQTNIAKTSLAGFSPGNIISDAVFTDENTMSEAKIQSFLNSKVSKCVVGKDEDGKPFVCLKDLKIPTQSKSADSYCSAYSGASRESSARIIYKVAQACNINPQVLIVMLQKEQGLVTHVWPSNWRYNKAMGQACPDTAPCDVAFAGFFAQVYGAARQMQIYMEGRYFKWYAAGKTWQIQYHPDRARCGTSAIYIANKATEALYYYTPYQPNRAALRAGYGTGDSCSSYGNRNFYNYFTDWFGSTQKPVNACEIPRDVRSAHGQYVTTTGLNARKAPTTRCEETAFTVAKGTLIQARRVTADGDWIEIATLQGLRWVSSDYLDAVSKADVAAVCTDPAGTTTSSGQYVVGTSTVALVSPLSKCGVGQHVSVGTVLQATRLSYSGKWLEVQTQAGPRWVSRDAVSDASPADIERACVGPKGTSTASNQYLVRSNGLVWVSPFAACGTGARYVGVGTVVQATRLSASGKWLEVRTGGGPRWIPRSAVLPCRKPAGTTVTDSQYVVQTQLKALLSPLSACGTAAEYWGAGTGPRQVNVGTVVQATRVSSTGKWIEVQTGIGLRWMQSEAVAVCTDPAGTRKASKQYVVTKHTSALISPLTPCGAGAAYWGVGTAPKALEVGTVVQALRVSYSGKWLQMQTSYGPRWVPRANVRER